MAVLTAALAACGRDRVAARSSPHDRVACVGCHRGGSGPSGWSGVPDAACAASGCHPSGGPDSARMAMVAFLHSGHPGGDQRAVPCAACHSHQVAGSLALPSDASACPLCHFPDIAGSRDAGCATCHASPRHTRRTSQGVPLSHAMIETARVPCTRCHYRLIEGATTVAVARCAACHRARPPTTLPLTDSTHGEHRAFACRACHSSLTHRVAAMSASVRLECLDCHAPKHRRPISADTALAIRCPDCHATVHADQQRLVLGVMPGEELRPSVMFMGGVTCRSCHAAPDGRQPRVGTPLRPTSNVCIGCHGPAWTGILARWNRGYERRRSSIVEYVAAAERALARDEVSPAALARLARARDLLAFVERAGPVHNLPSADRTMRRALAVAADAYALAGEEAPAVPALGPAVRSGTCIGCHYGIEEAPVGRDSATGRTVTHADHVLRAGLSCDACHAAGAAPPGVPEGRWWDSVPASLGPGADPRRAQ